jgi:hypothetical protein
LRKPFHHLAVAAWLLGCHTGCSLTNDQLPQQLDFEASLPPGWTYGSKAVSVTAEQVYSGGHSLKISSQNGRGRHYLSYDLRRLPQPANELYGTAMVFLDGKVAGGDFTLVQAEGGPKTESGAPSDVSVAYRVRVDGRHDHLMANYDTPGKSPWGTDCWKQPDFDPATPPAPEYRLPKNEWACLRWFFDARNNRLAFWLNDVPLHQIEINQTGDGCMAQDQKGVWHGPAAFEWLHLGIEQYHANAAAHTLFLDDLVIDTRPTACPVH